MDNKIDKALEHVLFYLDWIVIFGYAICSAMYFAEVKLFYAIFYFILSGTWVAIFLLHKDSFKE